MSQVNLEPLDTEALLNMILADHPIAVDESTYLILKDGQYIVEERSPLVLIHTENPNIGQYPDLRHALMRIIEWVSDEDEDA